MWAEHLRPIADAGYRVVAMDLPGFGDAPVAKEEAPRSDVVETMLVSAPPPRLELSPDLQAAWERVGSRSHAPDISRRSSRHRRSSNCSSAFWANVRPVTHTT